MLDKDGVKRPDKTDAHTLKVPQAGTKTIRKKKHILWKNPFFRFFGYILRIIILLLFTPFFWCKYNLKVEGRKNKKLIKGKGAVMIGNHCHCLDVMIYALKVFPRMNWITSIPENFQIPVAGKLINLLGAVPIPYDVKGMRLFKEVINERLKKKKVVTFFPEGSMWQFYRSLRPFKHGGFRFAVQNNVPILPAAVVCRIKHISLEKRKYKMTFVFLKPIYPDTALPEAAAVEKLKNETHDAMRIRIEAERSNDTYTKKYLFSVSLKEKSEKNE